jgi:hypothetical protein
MGGTIGGVLLGMAGIATEEPAGFMALTSLGIIAGNLTGRGAWRALAPRWAGRLDRLVSMLSGEALRNGAPVAALPPASRSPATAPAGEGQDR